MKKKNIKYTWRDLVCINGEVFAEEHPISGKTDGEGESKYWDIDDFLDAVAAEHSCNTDDITTYMMDGENFAPSVDMSKLKFGAESCGAYINGRAEWAY